MNYSVQTFFADEHRKAAISNAITKVQSAIDNPGQHSNEKYLFLLKGIWTTLFYMRSIPEQFDERCLLNIESIGEQFMYDLSNISFEEATLEYLFSYSYRFLIEFQLSTPDSISSDILNVLSRVSNYDYSGQATTQMRFASQQMVINVAKHYLYHPKLVALKELPDVIARSEAERETSEIAIKDREDRVAALADKLKSYETAFNFVGLYSGFQNMKQSKISERDWNFRYLIALGLLLTAPFVIKLFLLFLPSAGPALDFSGIATLIGAELLFVYFFRVALHNFRSIKAQLLQIELRMTLCQFVQSYAEYAKSAREGSTGLLDKFEQIVFSGIVNDESAIPSTFDGLEQLAGLVEKIRK